MDAFHEFCQGIHCGWKNHAEPKPHLWVVFWLYMFHTGHQFCSVAMPQNARRNGKSASSFSTVVPMQNDPSLLNRSFSSNFSFDIPCFKDRNHPKLHQTRYENPPQPHIPPKTSGNLPSGIPTWMLQKPFSYLRKGYKCYPSSLFSHNMWYLNWNLIAHFQTAGKPRQVATCKPFPTIPIPAPMQGARLPKRSQKPPKRRLNFPSSFPQTGSWESASFHSWQIFPENGLFPGDCWIYCFDLYTARKFHPFTEPSKPNWKTLDW